jgi:hypothetical protein
MQSAKGGQAVLLFLMGSWDASFVATGQNPKALTYVCHVMSLSMYK